MGLQTVKVRVVAYSKKDVEERLFAVSLDEVLRSDWYVTQLHWFKGSGVGRFEWEGWFALDPGRHYFYFNNNASVYDEWLGRIYVDDKLAAEGWLGVESFPLTAPVDVEQAVTYTPITYTTATGEEITVVEKEEVAGVEVREVKPEEEVKPIEVEAEARKPIPIALVGAGVALAVYLLGVSVGAR